MNTSPAIRNEADCRAGGFTLVELLVAVTLSAFILLGVLTTTVQLMRSGISITQYGEMESQVRIGLETLGHDLRSASAVQLNNSSDLTLTVPEADGSTTQVSYAWTSASQSLFRVPGSDSSVVIGRLYLIRGIPTLAGGLPGLVFTRLDGNGNPTSNDAATKQVRVTLTVKRQAGFGAAATESGVSETFALRNKSVG